MFFNELFIDLPLVPYTVINKQTNKQQTNFY